MYKIFATCLIIEYLRFCKDSFIVFYANKLLAQIKENNKCAILGETIFINTWQKYIWKCH